jgi:hypothetical protein
MPPAEEVVEILNRFQLHPALTEAKKAEHAIIRALHGSLAGELATLLPDGRERALALTALQESLMWSTACVAYAMP